MESPTTFRDWMIEQFTKEELEDIVNHGVDSGFSGLIYTKECCDLYDEHCDEIWNLAAEEAEAHGYSNVATFVGTFNRSDMANTDDGFFNLLVWFAAEHYAREILDDRDWREE